MLKNFLTLLRAFTDTLYRFIDTCPFCQYCTKHILNCTLSATSLKSTYTNCNDFTFNFQNESIASNITSNSWDFGVPGITTDVSTAATPAYTYATAGTYTTKLKVSNSLGSTDSAAAIVKVYPGFTPDFNFSGSCYQSPFQFTDAMVAR